jgi:membrane associated rhomboid family serine protease
MRSDESEGLKREWRLSWRVIGVTLAILWATELVDQLAFHGALDAYGVHPREPSGLVGVLTHPFLHGGFDHLLSNSVGIIGLGWLVAARGLRRWVAVTLAGVLLGGLGMWTFGQPDSVHIGASGVVFAYFGYLLLAGFFERSFGAILLSIVVGLLYGGMIFGVLPGQLGISWEGHLFGFLGGALMAWLLARRR